jgi:DNA polymerase-1
MYNPDLSTVVIDIETNLAHDSIWMVGVHCPRSGESSYYTNRDDLYRRLCGVQQIVGHNILAFDLPVLSDAWGFDWNRVAIDTLVIGRLLNPSIDGGHSLRAWAERAGGSLKQDFDAADFDLGLTEQMIDYCLADCKANWSVFQHQLALIEKHKFSWQSIELEHKVRRYTTEQERNGFAFDFPTAAMMHTMHKERMNEIEAELQATFPPIVEERWSEKTGKQLKSKVTVFNPGSRQQVAERLEAKGAVWTKFTETGKAKVDETTLACLGIPEADLVLEYLTLGKRLGMLKSWLDAVREDGRIHGRVNTCGAVTGRMTHSSPNLAQIPSEAQYRQCFIVEPGNKLVGIDASGLELRMLAHYMRDEEYTDLILHGDIHTHNQKLAGLPERNDAKTFIYALLYGAGDEKLGSIIGKGAGAGRNLRQRFMEGLPAYAKLIDKVKRIGAGGMLPGLDGRQLHIRSEHAALNTLLQSAGAIVMKQALVIASAKLAEYGYPYKLVAQVHDEFQVEVPDAYAERVGRVFRNSIREAGRVLDMRCPLDGEYQIGDSWAETH